MRHALFVPYAGGTSLRRPYTAVPCMIPCPACWHHSTGQEKRPLLAPNLRNAKREALLGEQWRALTKAEKALYKVEEAPQTAAMAPGSSNSPSVAAAIQPVTIRRVDNPSAARRSASEAAAPGIKAADADAAASGDRWSMYWNAKRAQR